MNQNSDPPNYPNTKSTKVSSTSSSSNIPKSSSVPVPDKKKKISKNDKTGKGGKEKKTSTAAEEEEQQQQQEQTKNERKLDRNQNEDRDPQEIIMIETTNKPIRPSQLNQSQQPPPQEQQQQQQRQHQKNSPQYLPSNSSSSSPLLTEDLLQPQPPQPRESSSSPPPPVDRIEDILHLLRVLYSEFHVYQRKSSAAQVRLEKKVNRLLKYSDLIEETVSDIAVKVGAEVGEKEEEGEEDEEGEEEEEEEKEEKEEEGDDLWEMGLEKFREGIETTAGEREDEEGEGEKLWTEKSMMDEGLRDTDPIMMEMMENDDDVRDDLADFSRLWRNSDVSSSSHLPLLSTPPGVSESELEDLYLGEAGDLESIEDEDAYDDDDYEEREEDDDDEEMIYEEKEWEAMLKGNYNARKIQSQNRIKRQKRQAEEF